MSFERDYGRCCEAPFHVDGCHGRGTTKDHFTPESIGRILGWKEEQIQSEENLQYLSPACHKAKDLDTPLRGQILKKQKSGVNIPFEVHRQIFEMRSEVPLQVFQQTGHPMQPGVEYDIKPPRRKRKK